MIFPVSVFQHVNAQYLLVTGARVNAIGGTAITLPDAFSVFSNPAAAAGTGLNKAGVYADHRYNIAGLNNVAFAGYGNIRNITVLGGVSRYGDELLSHSRAEAAVAYQIRNISLGGGAGVHQFAVAENGSAQTVTLQFGGTAPITPKLTYAAHAYNLTRSKLFTERKLYLPVLMQTGLLYKPVEKVLISTVLEKDSRFDPNFKAGLEYKLSPLFDLRTGFNTNPSTAFFGFGLHLSQFSLDYGISKHNQLGLTHFLGLVFSLKSSPENPFLTP